MLRFAYQHGIREIGAVAKEFRREIRVFCLDMIT
jgi:hypothetical protein